MRKLRKNKLLDKQMQSYILSEIAHKEIDVSGKLIFDNQGKALLRLHGFIIDIPTIKGNWSLVLKGCITAKKIYNHYTKKELKKYNSGYTVELFDENNNTVELESFFLTNVLNVLNNNTKIA